LIREVGISADPVRRERKRPQPIRLDETERQAIVERVLQFMEDDEQARATDLQLRKQRYAKLMQFSEEVSEPYEGASNVQLSDMMAACLRTEDTLLNASLNTRPIVNAKAISERFKERERKVDLLLDAQFFVEQDGEGLLEHLAINFVRDGTLIALSRWVRELRKILYTRTFTPIPGGTAPEQYFRAVIEKAFRLGSARPHEDSEG
jgi:hypothetical protein